MLRLMVRLSDFFHVNVMMPDIAKVISKVIETSLRALPVKNISMYSLKARLASSRVANVDDRPACFAGYPKRLNRRVVKAVSSSTLDACMRNWPTSS
jgi:hypothetical protein